MDKEYTILLVEDYLTNQLVASNHLQHVGYRVDMAEDGAEAVEAYKQKGL